MFLFCECHALHQLNLKGEYEFCSINGYELDLIGDPHREDRKERT